MRGWILVALCLGAIGCGSSDPWSPVGTYEMIKVWGGGTCFLTTPRRLILTVRAVDDGNDFELTIDDSDADTDLTILQSSDDCTLSLAMMEPPTTGIPFLGDKLFVFTVVETDGDLEGAGMLVVGPPDDCSQIFTVEGSKQ